jgi:hypothetical protein
MNLAEDARGGQRALQLETTRAGFIAAAHRAHLTRDTPCKAHDRRTDPASANAKELHAAGWP